MDLTRRSLALFGATALGGFALGGRAWADAPAAIRDLRLTADDASAMVRLDLDRQATARTFFLSNPDRFVIDVANARWAMAQGAHGEGPGSGVVRGYRFAPRPDGAGRLVLDLATPPGTRRSARSPFELWFGRRHAAILGCAKAP